jgi:hypothetical protein
MACGGMVYARGMFEMDGAVASRRQQFGVSNIDSHHFLAMQSAMEVVPSQKGKCDGFEEEARKKRM